MALAKRVPQLASLEFGEMLSPVSQTGQSGPHLRPSQTP